MALPRSPTHALAMALALVRHIPEFDRDIRAGRWHYSSTGPVTRATELTLGILGLGASASAWRRSRAPASAR
jgi:phosphoglycerate dehydrogenase-like enzyme